jgi:hypothetical protein
MRKTWILDYQDKVKIFNDSVRDYGAIDGDLIKATVIHNYKSTVLANKLYLESNHQNRPSRRT